MNRHVKRFLFLITACCLALTYSCGPKIYATHIPNIQSHAHNPIGKFPYKVAIVVDEKSINYIHEVMNVNQHVVHAAMGRGVIVHYKEILDKHFQQVDIVWKEDKAELERYDLKATMFIDEYYTEIPLFAVFQKGTLYTTVTFFIAPVNGTQSVKRQIKAQDTRMFYPATRDPVYQFEFFRKSVGMATDVTLYKVFSKFSFELQASPRLHILDFTDMEGFLVTLGKSNTSMSKYLRSKLDPFIRDELDLFIKKSDKNKTRSSKKKTIPSILENGVIKRINSIFEKESLKDVALETGIQVSAKQDKAAGTRGNLSMMNRHLFDQVYLPYVKALDTSVYDKLKSMTTN